MTSSVLKHIEVSAVRDVRTDDAALTVTLADGRSISTPLEWYPRLAFGTPQERAHWELIGGGEGIHWPDLDEDISVEGLIAGRKSGESGRSLKRWMEIQEKLRQMPRELPEWRREVLRVGALPSQTIVKRALETADAWDIAWSEWSVGVAAEPFRRLSRDGMNDDSACAVFQAESREAARRAKEACVARGMRSTDDEDLASDDAAYVFVFAAGKPVGGADRA